MSKIPRGAVYRVNLEPTQGSEQQGDARPCVILSITPFNEKLYHVGVIPLSSSAKSIPPLVVAIPSLGKDSVALCHQFRTIDKSRLGKYIGVLSPADMTTLENGVRQVYGL